MTPFRQTLFLVTEAITSSMDLLAPWLICKSVKCKKSSYFFQTSWPQRSILARSLAWRPWTGGPPGRSPSSLDPPRPQGWGSLSPGHWRQSWSWGPGACDVMTMRLVTTGDITWHLGVTRGLSTCLNTAGLILSMFLQVTSGINSSYLRSVSGHCVTASAALFVRIGNLFPSFHQREESCLLFQKLSRTFNECKVQKV